MKTQLTGIGPLQRGLKLQLLVHQFDEADRRRRPGPAIEGTETLKKLLTSWISVYFWILIQVKPFLDFIKRFKRKGRILRPLFI